MDHLNFDNLVKISKENAVRDMPKIAKPLNVVSEYCQHEKQTRVTFKTKEHSTTKPLEIVHTNLCGTPRTKILNGK